MNFIVFSTGSNIGDREMHLKYAIECLSKIGKIHSFSKIYKSKAWGKTSQNDFLNQVVVIDSNLNELECLEKIQEIENARQRKRDVHWGPRTLDIDILFFNQKIINTKKLIIPHPFIEKRLFVLLPLNEILTEFIHPLSKKNIYQLLQECVDESKVEVYENGL